MRHENDIPQTTQDFSGRLGLLCAIITKSLGRHQTPGISLHRTLCVYSLYPFNSSCKVWPSHWVRTINTSEATPTGTNAHKEPNESAMPIAWRIPPAYPCILSSYGAVGPDRSGLTACRPDLQPSGDGTKLQQQASVIQSAETAKKLVVRPERNSSAQRTQRQVRRPASRAGPSACGSNQKSSYRSSFRSSFLRFRRMLFGCSLL